MKDVFYIIAQSIAIAGAIGTVLNLWLRKQLNGATIRLDGRIDAMGKDVATLQQDEKGTLEAISGLRAKAQQAEFEIATQNREHGKLEGMFVRFIEEGRQREAERFQDEKKIAAQLANIEANLNVSVALERGFERLAMALRTEPKSKGP